MAPRTLEKAAAYHLFVLTQEAKSPETLRNYAMVERTYIAYVRDRIGAEPLLADLNVDRVRAYVVWLRDTHRAKRWGGTLVGHSDADLAYHARVLKIWSRLLEREFEALFPSGDPLARLRVPRVAPREPTVVTREQVQVMVDLCAQTREPFRNAAVLSFMIETGCRISEVCGLRRDRLELGRRGSDGQAIVLGKGNKERQVGFGPECGRALGKYLEMERPKEVTLPWVFLTADRRQLTPRAVRALLDALKKRAGIPGRVHPHAFRHGYATAQAEMGTSAWDLRDALGHTRIEQSLKYVSRAKRAGQFRSVLSYWKGKKS